MYRMKTASIIFFLCILFFLNTISFCAEKVILPNGLTLIVEEKREVPLVYLYLLVKTGSIYEGEYMGTGISHFVEHMIFRGGDKSGEIAQRIQASGGEINAYTTFDRTVYYVLIPSPFWKEGLQTLINAVLDTSFDDERIEKEREVILREMDLKEDNPESFLSMHFWKSCFTIHPYRFPVIGNRELFTSLSKEDLVRYYNRMYLPNNMVLVVCGDIEGEEVKEEVLSVTETFSPAPLSIPVFPEEPPQVSKRELALEKDVNMAYLNIGFHIPPFGDEDMWPLDVLAIILGGGRNSRLYKRLKEEESLVHSISSHSFTPRYEGLFLISATMKQENIEEVKRRIFEEIEKVKSEGLTEEELQRAQERLKMQELTDQQTLEGRTIQLALNYIFTGDLEFSREYLKKIEKVGKEEVVKVASKYLNESNSTSVVLRRSQRKKQKQVESLTTPESIKRELFPNGLTLIMRENSALPICSIVVIMGGGVVVEEKGNNGISSLLSSMFLKGTKRRSYEEIIERIESVGGSIGTYSGNNSLGVKITVHKKDVEMGLDLLADILINSDFPPDELKKEKEGQITQITREEDDIFTYAFKNLKKEFFKGHPYSFSSSGEVSTVRSIKRTHLFKLKNRLVVGKNLVISISGDFDRGRIKRKIRDLFSSLPVGERIVGGYPQSHRSRRLNLEGRWKQSILLIGFPAPPLKDKNYYILEVLDTYLTGQASPLFINLRDERSLAYSVGTFSVSGWDPGMFVFYIFTREEKLQEALEQIEKQIDKLKEGDFLETGIESAKKKLLTQKWKNLQKNESFAFQLALSELYGLGYEELLKLEEKISWIEKKDIIRFVNEYFKKEKSTILLLK